jgi:hypothetical protein
VTGEQRELLSRACRNARDEIALVIDRLGIDPGDAYPHLVVHIVDLLRLVRDYDADDFAGWEGELEDLDL